MLRFFRWAPGKSGRTYPVRGVLLGRMLVLLIGVAASIECIDRDFDLEQFCPNPCMVDAGSEEPSDAAMHDGSNEDATVISDAGRLPLDGGVPDEGFVDAGPALCGDGILVPPEACDDANEEGSDGCASDCTVVEAGYRCLRAGQACVHWWTDEATIRIPVVVTAGGSDLPAGFVTSVEFDHGALVARGARTTGTDLHLVYESPSGTFTELDRYLDPQSAWNGARTRLWFQLPARIAASEVSRSFFLYVDASRTPHANPEAIFSFYSGFDELFPSWLIGDGTSPKLVSFSTPWEGGSSSVLHAQNVKTPESFVSRSLPLGTVDVSMTGFVYLPDDFDSDPADPVLLVYYCTLICFASDGGGRIVGFGVDGARRTPFLSYKNGFTESDVVLPTGAWSRFELDIDQRVTDTVVRLRVNEEEAVTEILNIREDLRKLHVGVYWNETGTADVYLDNVWERPIVLDEPAVTVENMEPSLSL